MGPYCDYCGRRCFLPRRLPADARTRAGRNLIMATCAKGMEHDLAVTGYTHATAINPYDPGEAPDTAPAGRADPAAHFRIDLRHAERGTPAATTTVCDDGGQRTPMLDLGDADHTVHILLTAEQARSLLTSGLRNWLTADERTHLYHQTTPHT